MSGWQNFPVEAQPVKTDRLRQGVGLAYLLPENGSYEGASEFAHMFLDPGRVYSVVEVNRCGSFTQVALGGATIPAVEDAAEPCYCWFDHALFSEAEAGRDCPPCRATGCYHR